MAKIQYLHVSYVAGAKGKNVTCVGDSVVRLIPGACAKDIREWFHRNLKKDKPGIDWNEPTLISCIPISKELAEHLYPSIAKDIVESPTISDCWVARDGDSTLRLHGTKPHRENMSADGGGTSPYDLFWRNDEGNDIEIPRDMFPDLTFDNEPIEVEIVIRAKRP